jgi:PAS domain S-box-containing protein
MHSALLPNEKNVQKKNNESRYPWTPVTDTITNGFFTIDDHWMVTYWNKAAEELLRVPAKDIVGKNLWEEFAGVLPLRFYTVYHQSFLQTSPIHFQEYWGEMGAWFDVIIYPNDRAVSVSFKSSNHSKVPADPNRRLYPADPSGPKDREQRLTILNELYQFVTEVTSDCLWEWNLTARLLFWIDGGHKRVFGYPIENALIPQGFWESLLHPDDKTPLLERLNKMIATGTGGVWEAEYRFKKANGEYAFVHDRAHIIYDEENKISRMIGATQDITSRRSTETRLEQERLNRQKEITRAVLSAQEKERADIGKELHDNVNQILGAAKLYVELAKTDDENREMLLEKSSGYIVKAIEEIRVISKNLATPGLHLMGLFESIEILVEDLLLIHPIKIKFNAHGIKEEILGEKLQLDIFRIVQEQLNNILKHAKASFAAIDLTREGRSIVLLITDNGQGCDLTKGRKGVGLINIKSRAELYHGRVKVISSPGEGYSLKVLLRLQH